MLSRIFVTVVVVSLCMPMVAADVLESWGDGSLGTDFLWNPVSNRLVIVSSGGNEYRFWVHDGGGDPNTGVIDSITINDPNSLTGDFSLLIGYPLDPNDPNSAIDPNKPGAGHWKSGDLTYPGGTSTILGVRLAGNLCGDGDGHHDNIFCDVINGDIVVGGWLSEIGGGVPTARKLQANSITGDIRIESMLGDIVTGSLDGDVTLGDMPGGRTAGEFFIGSSYGGAMHFTDPTGFDGAIKIAGDFTGLLTVDGVFTGDIEVDGDLVVGDSTAPGRLRFSTIVIRHTGSQPPNVHIHGSITGSSSGTPAILARNVLGGGGLEGTIAIDGSLNDVISDNYEMVVATIDGGIGGPRGAIVVDYDGWDPNDIWDPDATILVGDPNEPNPGGHLIYNENTPSAYVYEITPCKGDLNNNEMLDSGDVTALGLALVYPGNDEFVDDYAGLEGSIQYHGDINCDGEVDSLDLAALEFFVGGGDVGCCMSDPNCGECSTCRADLDRDGEVDLDDLATVLSSYGSACDPNDPNSVYDSDADIDADCDVDLDDLAALLAAYGEECSCFGGGESASGGNGESTGAAAMSWVARNTLGTAAGYFIFDLNVELTNTADVWTANGVALTAQSGAAFVLASTPTTQNAAATFVCAPGGITAESSASVEIAGSFSPPDASEVFDTDEINIVWYDPAASTSDSGAAMRLVIDVSSVTDGGSPVDVSSVYFSGSGPARQGDVLIANVATKTGTVFGGADAASTTGALYAAE